MIGAGELREAMRGDVLVQGDEAWNNARQAWNLAVDQRPAAVVVPDSAAEVAAVISHARERGLRVAPQATGHSAAPLGSLEQTILLKTSRLRGVDVDPGRRRARVGAGVQWGEVNAAATAHGLAALAGSSPTVGVVGYTLGGGLSWLSRKHGLAANAVTAVEAVTADGRLVRADAENDPDLFWAIRGGGGSFAIVTALEFELFPIREVYAGSLFWPLERTPAVLHAWRSWVEKVPDETTSIARVLHVPPLPAIPEPLRGRSFVVVHAVHIGDELSGRELLQPLRDVAPELETFQTMPPDQLASVHMDPPQPVPGAAEGMLLVDFPARAVDAVVATAGVHAPTPLLSVEIRHLGGALAQRADGSGALGSLDAAFALFAVGMAPTPEAKTTVDVHIRLVQRALDDWDAGIGFMNFAERANATRELFPAPTHERLRAVKAQYDPDELLHANHCVPPARANGRRAA